MRRRRRVRSEEVLGNGEEGRNRQGLAGVEKRARELKREERIARRRSFDTNERRAREGVPKRHE